MTEMYGWSVKSKMDKASPPRSLRNTLAAVPHAKISQAATGTRYTDPASIGPLTVLPRTQGAGSISTVEVQKLCGAENLF